MTGEPTTAGSNPLVCVSLKQLFQQLLLGPVPGFASDDLPLPLPTILPVGGDSQLAARCRHRLRRPRLRYAPADRGRWSPRLWMHQQLQGEPKATGQAGLLTASDHAVVAQQGLTVTASQLPNDGFGMLFKSQARANTLIAQSQGVLCMGAPRMRPAAGASTPARREPPRWPLALSTSSRHGLPAGLHPELPGLVSGRQPAEHVQHYERNRRALLPLREGPQRADA